MFLLPAHSVQNLLALILISLPAQFNHHYFLEIIHHFNKSQHYFGSNEFTSTKVVDMTQIKALLSQPAILIKNQNNWVAICYPII